LPFDGWNGPQLVHASPGASTSANVASGVSSSKPRRPHADARSAAAIETYDEAGRLSG
jgi:hypothetical protein